MLIKFHVENFKSFDKPLTFDLGHSGSYEFNTEAVQDGVVTKGIVYGFNGCGKSNLGLAMFDIVTHLTDMERLKANYFPYLNLDSAPKPATFQYLFRFNGIEVSYHYQKAEWNYLLRESLSINGEEVISYDFTKSKGSPVRLAGAETLNLNLHSNIYSGNISRVKFIRNNAILEKNETNKAFQDFMNFVDGMLLFYSLERIGYQGYRVGVDNIQEFIINAGKIDEFSSFLQENNINLRLSKGESGGETILLADFPKKQIPFARVASSGTKALTLFYYWKLQMEHTSFVFMDEFDAFYHFELAESVVKLLLKSFPKTQVIFTTHNTDLLSNDILRPDCYFWLNDSSIKPLCDLTDKDIRKAHNLQKMFKAGVFQEGGGHA